VSVREGFVGVKSFDCPSDPRWSCIADLPSELCCKGLLNTSADGDPDEHATVPDRHPGEPIGEGRVFATDHAAHATVHVAMIDVIPSVVENLTGQALDVVGNGAGQLADATGCPSAICREP